MGGAVGECGAVERDAVAAARSLAPSGGSTSTQPHVSRTVWLGGPPRDSQPSPLSQSLRQSRYCVSLKVDALSST